ncbi:DUF721 domain-containing protein [bacterium]|nr:DUF721 domain-containing protein [bacterium]
MTKGSYERTPPWQLWEREWKRKSREPGSRHKGQVIPLDGLLGEWGRGTKVRAALREAELFNRWADIIGEKLAQQAIPERLDRGKLVIQVEDSSWRHQLLYMRRELIGKINQALGSGVVKEIVFTA